MEYVIRARPEIDEILYSSTDRSIFANHVDALAGRPGIATYCLNDAAKRGRRGRRASSYVATASGSPFRKAHGRGFIIEIVSGS